MTNTVALSTDINNAIIYDPSSGNASSFSLGGNGVKVSLNSNQLQVQTVSSVPAGQETKITDITQQQWTLTYHENNTSLYVIGITDAFDNKSKSYHVDLGSNDAYLRRDGNDLIILIA